jgi:hypothetical protein
MSMLKVMIFFFLIKIDYSETYNESLNTSEFNKLRVIKRNINQSTIQLINQSINQLNTLELIFFQKLTEVSSLNKAFKAFGDYS